MKVEARYDQNIQPVLFDIFTDDVPAYHVAPPVAVESLRVR